MPTSDSPHTAGVPPATASVELPKVPVVEAIALMLALLVAVFAFQLNASMLSPALKTMEVELETTEAQIGLTQTAFFTAAALFSLFLPRWGGSHWPSQSFGGHVSHHRCGLCYFGNSTERDRAVCRPCDSRRLRPNHFSDLDYAAAASTQRKAICVADGHFGLS